MSRVADGEFELSFRAEVEILIQPPKLEDESWERLFLATKLELSTFSEKHFLYMLVFITDLFSDQHRPVLHLFVDSLNRLFSKLLKSTVCQVLYQALGRQISTTG